MFARAYLWWQNARKVGNHVMSRAEQYSRPISLFVNHKGETTTMRKPEHKCNDRPGSAAGVEFVSGKRQRAGLRSCDVQDSRPI
jgi:hypothetical protein